MNRAIDTLDIARRKFPGAQASLDALCKRFGVDNSAREKHGALLDSEILAEVYLELLGGRQQGLTLSAVGRPMRYEGHEPQWQKDWVPSPASGVPCCRRITEGRGASARCRIRGRTGR